MEDSRNIVLSIDTASFILNASLYVDGQFYSKQVETENSNNEELSNLIDMLLKEAGIKIKDVSKIIINQGPGSFTGLRIGYAYIIGISSSLNIPIVQISLLKAISYSYKDKSQLVCLFAKKDMFFIYDSSEDKLLFESKEFIKNYLATTTSGKVYLFKKDVDDFDFQYTPVKIIPSKVLLEYQLALSIPQTSLLELEPNYIQKISAVKKDLR